MKAKRGDRVRFISTTDQWTRMTAGELGTVTVVDSLNTVHVHWDSGSRLGMVPGEDRFEIVTPVRED